MAYFGTCDRCGDSTAALVEVLLESGGRLVFCGHHAKQAEKAGLKETAASWDESGLQAMLKGEADKKAYVEAEA